MSSDTPSLKRSAFLIDGFNLYHAIDEVKAFHPCKWLNLQALAHAFIRPSQEMVTDIFFFTARPKWDQNKINRQEKLLSVYRHQGIHVRNGEFMPTTNKCQICKADYPTFQEKMTDMNICLKMLELGADNLADRIYLVTGDNDQVPAIRRFKKLYPEKQVIAVLPPNRHAKELSQTAHQHHRISREQLMRSILNDPFVIDAKTSISKPISWSDQPLGGGGITLPPAPRHHGQA